MITNAGGGPSHRDWRRRRRLRVALILSGLLLVVGIITVWPRGGGETDEIAAGQLDGSTTTTLDTRPFQLILPDGPTTIPDEDLETTTQPPPPRPTAPPTTTSPPTTTIPPTTTTTLPPIPPDDPICQAFVKLFEFARAGKQGVDDTTMFGRRVLALVNEWIEKLPQMDPPVDAGAIEKLTDIQTRLRDRPTDEEFWGILNDLLQPDPRFAPLIAYRDRVCPTVGLER